MNSKEVLTAFAAFLGTNLILGLVFPGFSSMLAGWFGIFGQYAAYIGSSIASFVVFVLILVGLEHVGVDAEIPGAN